MKRYYSKQISHHLNTGLRTLLSMVIGLSTVLLINTAIPGEAYASLLISPTRVALNDRERTAIVTLSNPSNETTTYRIEWIEQKMDDNGDYVSVDPNSGNSALLSPMMRYSPRRITIGPGEYQKVRLSLRIPKALAEGEYRSHLLFRSEPPTNDSSDSKMTGGTSLQVRVNLSFSIPIIFRHGPGSAEVSIDDVAIQPEKKGSGYNMVTVFSRTGEFSSFGIVEIFLRKASSGTEERIGLLNNVAIFADSKKRKLVVPLQRSNFSSGDQIRIIYKGDDEYEGKVWAEKSFRAGR